MDMNRHTRLTRLQQQIKRNGKLHLKEAATLLGVSEMTVRRDIAHSPDAILLLGGYLVSPKNNAHPYHISDQANKHRDAKMLIAEKAAKRVSNDATIFFDCGTTIPFLIDAIDDSIHFTGVCYSRNAFMALMNKPHCRVVLCGGEYHEHNGIFTPMGLSSELDLFNFDMAFMSAAGVSLSAGASCFEFNEVAIKQRALSKSTQRILLADSSKFNTIKAPHIGPIELFTDVITDQCPDKAFILYCQDKEISLLY